MKSTEERELKLGAGPGFRLPELAGELLPPRTLTSVYLDTPDHRPPARASPPCWRRSCEFIEDPHERPVGVLEGHKPRAPAFQRKGSTNRPPSGATS